jgi:5-methylcytosine-specific restriction enzyme A
MEIDVQTEILEILDAYELTIDGEILLLTTNKYPHIDIQDEDEEFPEGKLLTQLHMRKERNPRVVLRKKKKVLAETGKLECEVCGFDFEKKYGSLGYGFIECHHTVRVSELVAGNKTRLSDLSIVCSNCHQMLHRSRPLLSVDELQEIMKINCSE